MKNIYSRNKEISRLLKNKNLSKKIYIYFATRSYGPDYDPYEDNYTMTDSNPVVIRGIVTQLTPTSLVWKEFGLKEQGAVEIICESKYKNWFESCNKIEIDGNNYAVFREGTGNKAIITDLPFNLIRVVLQRQ